MLSDLKFNALILHKMALSRPCDEINYHLFLAFSIKRFLNSKYQNFVVKYMFHGDNLKVETSLVFQTRYPNWQSSLFNERKFTKINHKDLKEEH